MKNNREYLWKYLIIMFSIALALVAVSTIQQYHTQRLMEDSLNNQKILTEDINERINNVTEQNENLREKNEQLKKDLTAKQSKIEELEKTLSSRALLIDAQVCINSGDIPSAKKALNEIQKDNLDEVDLKLYKSLSDRLK